MNGKNLETELNSLRQEFEEKFDAIKSKYLKDTNGVTIFKTERGGHYFGYAINIESIKEDETTQQ